MDKKNKKLNIRKDAAGFTLIELIVVMAVFLFIIGAAIVIFISIIQHQKRVLSEQELLNQISYAEEYMSKAMRMAKAQQGEMVGNYYCLRDGDDNVLRGFVYLLTRFDLETGLYRGIRFINQSDDSACQEFFLDNLVSGDTSTPLVLKELKNSLIDSEAVPITSERLEIKSVKFAVNGTDGTAEDADCIDHLDICGASDDGLQPKATILLNVKTRDASQAPEITIQTTVSQRDLNKRIE